jgi:hypothetical protein
MSWPKKSNHLEQRNRPTSPKTEPEAAQVIASPPRVAGPPLLQLQRTRGNRYVQRLVARLRGGTGPVIQPQLVVGPVGDKYEQEADQVAARIMQMPVNEAGQVQRTTLAEELTPVQRQSDAGDGAGLQVAPEIEQRIAHPGGGQPLPETVRQSLEPRFGADFSGVRVHTDAAADQLNHSLQAQAFTAGQNIFFRRGGYAPGSASGQRLLAHELTHVVQQTGAGQGTENAQRSVVQRRLLVQDGEVNLSLLLKLAPDMATRVIIANWAWSDTPHNFSSVEKLFEAINAARLKSKDVPALYSSDNLEFLTQTPGRLPTLYFKSGINSGRIRQQHGSGPAVIAETYKKDYFFEDNADKSNFAEAASAARRANPKLTFHPNSDDPETYFNVKLDPTEGDYHCEVTFTGTDTWIVQKVHPSEGRIVTDTSTYNDEKIKKIYQSAIGYTT